ncbi:MAG: GNAT family N-acetyltransferase [Pseudomonadota bacterium]
MRPPVRDGALPMQISLAEAADAPRLFEVWEASVRATHHFLPEHAIAKLAPIVRELLHTFTPIHCIRDASGLPYAFMGTSGSMLEMLFVDPARRGNGAGRVLVAHAIERLGVTEVDVNEDNAQALGFYEHLGFRRHARSPVDAFGDPYPILHLKR